MVHFIGCTSLNYCEIVTTRKKFDATCNVKNSSIFSFLDIPALIKSERLDSWENNGVLMMETTLTVSGKITPTFVELVWLRKLHSILLTQLRFKGGFIGLVLAVN